MIVVIIAATHVQSELKGESENETGVSCDNTLAIINPMNHQYFLLFLQLKFRIPDLAIY